MKIPRGFFEIGIYCPKTEHNIGTLWRSAYQLGATGIFTVGHRYRRQASDTLEAWRHIPLRQYATLDDMLMSRPYSSELIGVEMGGKSLGEFTHPLSATYLLGAEDYGLPAKVLAVCNQVVSLDAIRTPSFNVAVARTLVMYDRMMARKVALR